jgi:hypothetical protein
MTRSQVYPCGKRLKSEFSRCGAETQREKKDEEFGHKRHKRHRLRERIFSYSPSCDFCAQPKAAVAKTPEGKLATRGTKGTG